jgi:hypothetical protein
MNKHLNNEGWKCKTRHLKGEGNSSRRRLMKRLKWIIWLRYFLYMYEYGTLKSVNVIF